MNKLDFPVGIVAVAEVAGDEQFLLEYVAQFTDE
jgi:hypothetical protein